MQEATPAGKFQSPTAIPPPLFESFAIPNPIMFHIFSQLDYPTLLCSVPLVCRRWRELSGQNEIWKPIFKARWPHLLDKLPPKIPLKNEYIIYQKARRAITQNCYIQTTKTEKIPQLNDAIAVYENRVVTTTRAGEVVEVCACTGEILGTISIKHLLMPQFHVEEIHRTSTQCVLICSDLGKQKKVLVLDISSYKVIKEVDLSFPVHKCSWKDAENLYVVTWNKIVLLHILTGVIKDCIQIQDYEYLILKDNKLFIQEKNGSIQIYDLEDNSYLAHLPCKGDLIEVAENALYTAGNVCLCLWDLKTCTLWSSIRYLDYLPTDSRHDCTNLKVYMDIMVLQVDTVCHVNQHGQLVQESHRTFPVQTSTLLFFDRRSLKFLRKVDLDSHLCGDIVFNDGRIICKTNDGDRQTDRLSIIDLPRQAILPSKNAGCVLL